MDPDLVLLGLTMLIFGLGVALGAWVAAAIARWRFRLERDRAVAQARGEAVDASRRVIRGLVTEQMAPFLQGFDFDPGDARFIGNPVDFVVFDGFGEGALRSVTLVEVKTGRSRLNDNQRAIREAVETGLVPLQWKEVRLPG